MKRDDPTFEIERDYYDEQCKWEPEQFIELIDYVPEPPRMSSKAKEEITLFVDRMIHAMSLDIPKEYLGYPDYPTNPCADIEIDCLGHTPAQAAAFDAMCEAHDTYFWPHKNGCPLCGSDAYVGFTAVECSMSSCKNFVWKAGM